VYILFAPYSSFYPFPLPLPPTLANCFPLPEPVLLSDFVEEKTLKIKEET
jgi:hypothetical protein